jgi:integrase/recombinase XerC
MPLPNHQFSSFLDFLKFEKRYSKHTLLAYEGDLNAFFDYVSQHYGDVPLPEVTHTLVRSWLAGLKESGVTSKSINRKISTLRSFFKYGVRTGALEQTPMTKIIAPKSEKRLPQFVAEGEMSTLLQHVEFPDTWQGKTEHLLVLLFYNTGMRLSELVHLREEGVNSSANTIKVLGKGNKERVIPVSPKLVAQMSGYMAEKRRLHPAGDHFLLVTGKGKQLPLRSVYNVIKKYLTLVTTLEKRSPHVLRHTFATHLLNAGADLNAVKELLGHSSLAATQVYTHHTIQKLKNAHQKAHPKA